MSTSASEAIDGAPTKSESPAGVSAGKERIVYDDRWVRYFTWATVLWGIVGMTMGVIVALQLAFWPSNAEPYFTFGRLRPLHTNAVIFAFVGNMMFAGIYYSSMRLLKANVNATLSGIHFWLWQAAIVLAAITLPLGLTQGKEYAELIWPVDLVVAVAWLTFAANFFLLIKNRHEKQLYVALWFYIATIVTITVLYVVNNLQLPYSLTGSYGVFAGVQDGLVQWWYGHNAVAFFLTTPILGIMYYYVPKAAGAPVYSYRLSIVHFWSLVFIYIWAGPHHLLNTALPDWAQSLGMVFSLMLWAPSWGGMLNGLMTIRGAWDKLRTDPILKFFGAALTFYGMATFEGPLLSIRSVSAIGHYTDWIIGHVHGGALGWNGLMTAGMFYWLVPKLYGRELHSKRAAEWHFTLAILGIILYMGAMYVSTATQSFMWRAESEDGGLLYPTFVETVTAVVPMYWVRFVGGLLYLIGFVMLAWNLVMTARAGKPVVASVEVALEEKPKSVPWGQVLGAPPIVLVIVVAVLIGASAFVAKVAGAALIAAGLLVAIGGAIYLRAKKVGNEAHQTLEGMGMLFTVLTTVAILLGGIAEIVPIVAVGLNEQADTAQHPYTPLELEGRDVYVAEGCYTCHSQMIRPFTWETARFGAPSEIADSIWDRPYQWGSKRTGPDLAREGGRYPNLWHYHHMIDPRQVTEGSIMPNYAHLASTPVNFDRTSAKLRAMQTLGVPYRAEDIAAAALDAREQAQGIVDDLRTAGQVEAERDSELVALIAYLQRLGRHESPFTPSRLERGGTRVSQADSAQPGGIQARGAE